MCVWCPKSPIIEEWARTVGNPDIERIALVPDERDSMKCAGCGLTTEEYDEIQGKSYCEKCFSVEQEKYEAPEEFEEVKPFWTEIGAMRLKSLDDLREYLKTQEGWQDATLTIGESGELVVVFFPATGKTLSL